MATVTAVAAVWRSRWPRGVGVSWGCSRGRCFESSFIMLPAGGGGDLCVCFDCVECQGWMYDRCDAKHEQRRERCGSNALFGSVFGCVKLHNAFSPADCICKFFFSVSPNVPKKGSMLLFGIFFLVTREAGVFFEVQVIFEWRHCNFNISQWLTNTRKT